MNFQFSEHAEEEASRRHVPRDLLRLVLKAPEQIVAARGGKQAYQSRVDFGEGQIFLLRAIVAHDTDPPTVVTVYRTSKIKKYWASAVSVGVLDV